MAHRIFSIQFGNYYETWHRLKEGHGENYHAQKYSVEHFDQLTSDVADEAIVVTVAAQHTFKKQIRPGLWGGGLKYYLPKARTNWSELRRMLQEFQPTHIILQVPIVNVIKWAKKNDVKILLMLADSFDAKGLRSKIFNARFSRVLNDPHVSYIGNHNIPACHSLQRIGISPSKLIPWDWPHELNPNTVAVKAPPNAPFRILYIGAIMYLKGVGDILDAAKILKARELAFHVDILGNGEDNDALLAQVKRDGLGDVITFHGRVDRDEVLEALKKADISLVPSRHEYAEGLPLTIYEAFATRTPLIASDHPMFMYFLRDNENAAIVAAGQPEALATRIEEVLTTPSFYSKLSEATAKAWEEMQCPVLFGELLDKWLSPDEAVREQLRDMTIAATGKALSA